MSNVWFLWTNAIKSILFNTNDTNLYKITLSYSSKGVNGSHRHNTFRLDLCSHSVVQKSNFWVFPYWDRIVIYYCSVQLFSILFISIFCNKIPFPLQNQGKIIVNVSVPTPVFPEMVAPRCFPKLSTATTICIQLNTFIIVQDCVVYIWMRSKSANTRQNFKFRDLNITFCLRP